MTDTINLKIIAYDNGIVVNSKDIVMDKNNIQETQWEVEKFENDTYEKFGDTLECGDYFQFIIIVDNNTNHDKELLNKVMDEFSIDYKIKN